MGAELSHRITLTDDDDRRVFESRATDGTTYTYRLSTIDVLTDGSVWCWAAQLTKKGRPYANGMGLTMGSITRMAEFYGQAVLDVVTEALSTR